MAHHGGPETLPRAHRARAPAMSVAAPPPTIAPLAPLPRPQQPAAVVTLQAPRPESDRKGNEYVDNPLPFAPSTPPHRQRHAAPPASSAASRRHHLHLPLDAAAARRPPPPPVPAISKQPGVGGGAASAQSRSFRKGGGGGGGGPPASLHHEHRLHDDHHHHPEHHHHHHHPQQPPVCASRRSIVCDECGRCRCFDCQQPPRLPVCWLCNNHCLCSADAAVDYASCLCCVKGVYYHCSDSDSGGVGESTCADEPCGCGPERRAARWGCLAVLSVVLPCLWLYWPLQGCKSAVEGCYSRYSKQGCRCRPPLNTPEKRLLDSSPDF